MVAKAHLILRAFVLASTIAHCEAVSSLHWSGASGLAGSDEMSIRGQSAKSSISSGAIPDWKVGLVATEEGSRHAAWWQNLGISSLWGGDLPSVASSPAQDQQRCPVLKLPDDTVMAASSSSWMSLQGKWYTPTSVDIATFDQNYFGFTPWDWNVTTKYVNFRAASTGQVAVRTRLFTDAAIQRAYNWNVPVGSQGANNSAARVIDDDDPANIALMDCVGNLMYVARVPNPWTIILYSRNGSIITSAVIEEPILRMQFVVSPNNYLVATAEAPGINAKMLVKQIPKDVEFGNVLPFEIQFAPGGYNGSSPLMDPEFRWVLAVAVQAFSVYKAERDYTPWHAFLLSWVLCISTYLLSIAVLCSVAFMIYRCVYPHHEDRLKDHYGKIASNPFFAVPERPPHRDQMAMQSRQYAQQLGLHGKSMMPYGTLV